MPYDELLANRLRRNLAEKNIPFREKAMMGGLIFMVKDKMCLGVDVDRESQEPRLMARIGKEAYEAALEERGVEEMDFTGKVMRGFIFIYPEGFQKESDLSFWVDKAYAFNEFAKKSPPKKKKRRED